MENCKKCKKELNELEVELSKGLCQDCFHRSISSKPGTLDDTFTMEILNATDRLRAKKGLPPAKPSNLDEIIENIKKRKK